MVSHQSALNLRKKNPFFLTSVKSGRTRFASSFYVNTNRQSLGFDIRDRRLHTGEIVVSFFPISHCVVHINLSITNTQIVSYIDLISSSATSVDSDRLLGMDKGGCDKCLSESSPLAITTCGHKFCGERFFTQSYSNWRILNQPQYPNP